MRLTSREIANISILTALSAVMMLVGVEYPFIYLPYLKFDVAELPIYMISILFGVVPTIVSVVIIALIVAVRNPLGALFKFIALIVNGLSIAIPIELLKKKLMELEFNESMRILWLIGAVSVVIRSVALTIANYYLIAILWGPINQVASLYGYTVGLLLMLTFVFNIIQGFINVGGSILVTSKLPPEWVPDWLRR